MEIKAGKNAEFIIKYSNGTISIDPNQKSDANLVMLTNGRSSSSKGLVLDWPGEYEAENVLCTSIQILDGGKESRILNIEVDGFRMAFLGNIAKLIPEKVLKDLSAIEILVLPLNMPVKEMQILVEEIEPQITLISKDDEYKDEEGTLKYAKYLKLLGQENTESMPSLKLKNISELEDLNNNILLET